MAGLRIIGSGVLFAVGWLGLALPAIGLTAGTTSPPPIADVAVPATAHREQIGRLTHVHLTGTPEELGAAHGRLLLEPTQALEGDLIATFIDRVPGFPARHLLLGLVGINNRTLPGFFTTPELQELAAQAQMPDPTADHWRCLGVPFQRAVQYHALHDVSQYLIDNPLVRPIQVGCSAFAVGQARTRDGHLIAGRLFDFEGGPRFDLDKVVFTVQPQDGLRFVHVAWAGMTGAVTGLNEAGLWVSINAAATKGMGFCGRPIVMAVREILQHCHTIDEAVTVLRRTPVFVSDGVLVVSRSENRAAVIEIGPTGLAVRPWQDDLVISTNHFLDPAWANDSTNTQRITAGTTNVRYARLETLLTAAPLDPATAVAILRDRRGPGGVDVGFNNRSTINAWIGAHLAVADVTRGILWVSEPRHGLGAMRAFTVDGPLPAEDLPADAELARCENDLPRWLAAAAELRELLPTRAAHADRCAELAEELLRLNPRSFESHWLAGLAATDPAQRQSQLEQALALHPAYPADAKAIHRSLAGATATAEATTGP
jgi:hypothetical protein